MNADLVLNYKGKIRDPLLEKAVLMFSSMFKRNFYSIDKRTRLKNDHS